MTIHSICLGNNLPLLEPNKGVSAAMAILLIPDYNPEDPKPYRGDIQPGEYQGNEIVELLHQHGHDPEAIRFIADLLEE
jgi:hypothetical protein